MKAGIRPENAKPDGARGMRVNAGPRAKRGDLEARRFFDGVSTKFCGHLVRFFESVRDYFVDQAAPGQSPAVCRCL